MPEQMITLREFEQPEEAERDHARLADAGFHPVVVDNRPESVSGYLPVISKECRVQLQVPEDEAAEAHAILLDSGEQHGAFG